MEEKTERERIMADFKCDLNNFLFSKVPESMTIGEFDELTAAIHLIVDGAWERAEVANA